MTRAARAARTGAAALALALHSLPAAAQFVGSLGIATQDRYRGQASDPPGSALRLALSADGPAGVYASVAAVGLLPSQRMLRSQALVGLSQRIDDRLAWDAGLLHTHFSGDGHYDYSEAMVGLVRGEWALRAWLSPHYFGQPAASLYLDLQGTQRLADGWRLLVHLGHLRYGAGPAGSAGQAARTDALLGVGWLVGAFDLRLSVDGRLDRGASDAGEHPTPGAVLSLSTAF